MLKNKKVVLLGTVLVAGAIAMTGTFAWFTDSDTVVNKMKLARFNVKITEEWKEEENKNLEPNAEVSKVVRVANNGTADAVVRVSIDEAITLFKADQNANEPTIFWGEAKIENDDATKVAVPNYVMPQKVKEEKKVEKEIGEEGSKTTIEYYDVVTSLKDGETQCYVAVVDSYDGLVRYNPNDGGKLEYAYYEYADSTIEDTIDYFEPQFRVGTGEKEWTLIDGYYYYNSIVKAGETTEPLFEKVEVSESLPNTYIGSKYNLTPNMQAVQANGDAVMSEFAVDSNRDSLKAFVIGLGLTVTETTGSTTVE